MNRDFKRDIYKNILKMEDNLSVLEQEIEKMKEVLKKVYAKPTLINVEDKFNLSSVSQ